MPNSISKELERRASSSRSAVQIKDAVLAKAREEGFDIARVTGATAAPILREGLEAYLALGHHGEMAWMETRAKERADPQTLWPEARSAIVLGLNYGPERDPMAVLAKKNAGAISCYALGDDYHEIVKKKLKAVAGFLFETTGAEVKLFVDTAPVMEKPLAQKAGLGWQGKHSNLVSREFGSWLFLGTIFTTLELPVDPGERDHCGQCRRCLDACPTSAFPKPYQLDARRCISYLTIEHKGPIPREFREAMGNRIYGCDDCLAVCPWNKFATRAREMKLHARAELEEPKLEDLARLEDTQFRARFRKSPVKRIGRDRFVRNVLIAIGNSGEPRLAEEALRLSGDPSPLVRGAAVWALKRLLPAEEFGALAAERTSCEMDRDVRDEWLLGA